MDNVNTQGAAPATDTVGIAVTNPATPAPITQPVPPTQVQAPQINQVPPPPAVAPTPVPPVSAPQGISPVQFPEGMSTGDAMLDASVIAMCTAGGITPQDFIAAVTPAIESGDVTKADYAKLAKNPAMLSGMMSLVKGMIDNEAKSANNVKAQAYEVAGGEQNWKNAVALFNQSAPSYLRSTVSAMIDGGDVKNGAQMVLAFVQQKGYAPQGNPVMPNAVAQGTGSALSALQFREELSKLTREAGNRSLEGNGIYAQRYRDLINRRQAGVRAGL